MKIALRNLTPHPVVLYATDPLGGDADLVYTIEPEGCVPRVAERVMHTGPLGRDGDGWFAPGPDAAWGSFDDFVMECRDGYLPLTRLAYGEVTDLPPAEEATILIVSRVIVQACPDRTDLRFPHDMVRDEAGRVVGCRALAR